MVDTNQTSNFGTEPTGASNTNSMNGAQQQQQPQPAPANAPAPTPTQQPAVAPSPTGMPAPVGKPKPGVKGLTKEDIIQKERVRNKKVLIGCGGAFGCGTILLLVLIFVFVGTASSGSSELAKGLGINQQQLINTLITIVNLFFGIGAFIAFIMSIGGVFKALMARKDDKFAKKNGWVMAGSSLGVLIIIIVLWIGAWFYLNNQQIPQDTKPTGIVTVPEETLNLTAPIDVTFNATNLKYDSRAYDIVSYFWDFGDGNSGPGTSLETHRYEVKGDGRFGVKLILTFKNKTSGEESTETLEHLVTIGNEEVTAILEADQTEGNAPLTVKFDGSKSTDPDGEIKEYAWQVEGQGFEAGDETFEYTFEQLGTYKVSLRVTNQNGDYAIAEKEIEVAGSNLPRALIGVLNSDDGKYYLNKSYTFDASKSSSPSGDITNYEWDFGDGTTKARTRTAQHIFKQEGTYNVVLTVIDEDNKAAEAELLVDVSAAPSAPVAQIRTVPSKEKADDISLTGVAPFEVVFDATASTDPDNDIVDYNWDFDGDGAFDSVGENTSYTFNTPGNYAVTLVVIDSDGAESSANLLVVAESPGLQPLLIAEPVSGVVPLTVDFDATGSEYADGSIVSYEWSFGDGTPKRSDVGQVTYKYTKIGNFTATVTVRTDDNKEAKADVLISVRQVPLKSCFEPSKTEGRAPATIVFNPSCSTGTIAKYRWDFGDGETSSQNKPTHIYDTPGSYEVVLEVSDAQNVVDVSSQFITVTGNLTTQ